MSKPFLSKPFSYWKKEAHKLVVEQLVRAANLDTRSIIGKLASERLMTLAKQEDEVEVKKVLENKRRFQEGFARAFNAMVGH